MIDNILKIDLDSISLCEISSDGIHCNSLNKEPQFTLSNVIGKNFIYTANIKFNSESGSSSLIFKSKEKSNINNCYSASIDIEKNTCKLSRYVNGEIKDLSDEIEVSKRNDNTYNLKVIVIDQWILYYVNNKLIASTGDYTLTKEDKGQNTCIEEGYIGISTSNCDVIFKDINYTEINDKNDPSLLDVYVVSQTGTIEKKTQFNPNEPITIQYVSNEVNKIDIITKSNNNSKICVTDSNNNIYEEGKNIPLEVGKNIITVTSTIDEVTLTYRINVHRRQEESIYYNEQYRSKYHYTVKDGWLNDPNGLVYYNGKYHMFYQFYDDLKWGPMHWGHTTSKDLIYWNDEPIALYPDTNGAMFSGCIVVDDKNTSKLFKTEDGGLVAFITCDGNGQRIKLAYSEDEGTTWTKLNKIILDWSDDPLQDEAFRDPKVFRWENKWFMVVAGGPLRIYSSDNLINWKCESTYKDINTECPDLYPIKTSDNKIKWVLSRGGRLYKVGDFKIEDNSWKYIPDKEYENNDGIMNFGKDSYAAMTFYKQDFGTKENPTIPEIYEVNWMNAWDDYCNKIAETLNQKFNGTFNLILKLGLIKENNKYLLTQTPIEEYKSLRKPLIELKNKTLKEVNEELEKLSLDSYEIVSTLYKTQNTQEIVFKVRKGNNESTDIIYDINNKKITLDRSNSGIIISDKFKEIDTQDLSTNNNQVKLHIFVDKASIEVFTNNYTICGANQIFPTEKSRGLSIKSDDNELIVDIEIYSLEGIWNK